MLGKGVSSTIFKVFGMTRPGIEPRSPRPLPNTLPNYHGFSLLFMIVASLPPSLSLSLYIYIYMYLFLFFLSIYTPLTFSLFLSLSLFLSHSLSLSLFLPLSPYFLSLYSFQSFYFFLFVRFSVCLSVCLFVCLSVCLSLSLSPHIKSDIWYKSQHVLSLLTHLPGYPFCLLLSSFQKENIVYRITFISG